MLTYTKKQKGDMLIEALISMVIVLILGMGPVFISSKMMATQKSANYQAAALEQMRKMLQTNDPVVLCNGTTKSITVVGTQLNVNVSCTNKASAITINSNAVTLTGNLNKDITLSVTNTAMFGEPGTLILKQ